MLPFCRKNINLKFYCWASCLYEKFQKFVVFTSRELIHILPSFKRRFKVFYFFLAFLTPAPCILAMGSQERHLPHFSAGQSVLFHCSPTFFPSQPSQACLAVKVNYRGKGQVHVLPGSRELCRAILWNRWALNAWHGLVLATPAHRWWSSGTRAGILFALPYH